MGAANPSPPARVTGERCKLPQVAGFGAETRLPKGFPLLSALRVVYADTIILLIRYGMVWYGLVEFNVPLDTV